MKNEDFTEESWNKKRIILFGIVTLLGIVGYFSKVTFLDKKNAIEEIQTSFDKVKGIQTKQDLKTDDKKIEPVYTNSLKEGIQEKLDEIKENVSGLKVDEVASSSPSIQKVLHDIKNLENLPRNQAKETCKKICEGI